MKAFCPFDARVFTRADLTGKTRVAAETHWRLAAYSFGLPSRVWSQLPCNWVIAKTLVVQAAHGQVDRRSRHPARLVGSHEGRHISHLRERHDASRVGRACEVPMELFPGHAQSFRLEVVDFPHRACFRHAVWSQTDNTNALRRKFGG